ncbi:MAG: hypothetical protein ABF633_03370 [Clostridium sp.]|uniref:hypothetical protein n=1 Tax=Clostridium sp. TaxID=1506 RepID=UPI0039E7E4B6
MARNDVLTEFENSINAMVEVALVPSLQERYNRTVQINEEFFERTGGSNLPSYLLNILADWILLEILKDKDVDKVSKTEFAILSPRQIRRRDKRENSVEDEIMDFLNLKYVKQKDSLYKKLKKASE